ncbi:MAG: benzoate/H(+) symporter BenE family transporter, partial [bacterium]
MSYPEPKPRFLETLRTLPAALTPTAFGTGLVTFTMMLTIPTLVIFQAATEAGFSDSQTGSWLFSVFAAGGLMTLTLSLAYGQPIAGGVSTIVAAFLVQALPGFSIQQAVGAYLIHGLLVVVLSFMRQYARLIQAIPAEIVMGALAGALLRFGSGVFVELARDPALVAPILAAWLLLARWPLRGLPPVVVALGVGVVAALALHPPVDPAVSWSVSLPEFYRPEFTLQGVFSLSIPLTLIVLSAQNASGIALLRSLGYRVHVGAVTLATGLFTLAAAAMGAPGVSLGAQRAAVAGDPSVHPDPGMRYGAMVVDAMLMLGAAFFATTLIGLFALVPLGMIRVVAGLAMLPVILRALEQSLGTGR